MGQCKLLVMDVDGTLTDGKIYMGPDGESMKAFHVKDGFAILHFLPEAGVIPAIITGRKSKILENRCQELKIHYLCQGVADKTQMLEKLLLELKLNWNQTAYIGDDFNDLDAMTAVHNGGGIVGCPQDAAREVRAIADYVTSVRGGEGAVREFIAWLVHGEKAAQ